MNIRFSPEIEFEDGAPLVPNVAPTVILRGSDFEMGRQYIQQLHEVLGDWVWDRLHRNLTEAELTAIKVYQEHIAKHTPEFIDMLKGMVAAADDMGLNLTYEQVLTEFCTYMGMPLEVYPDTGSASGQKDDSSYMNSCSGFAAWGSATKDGRLIGAATIDHSVEFHFFAVCYPDEGNSFIASMPVQPASKGMFPSMNNKGLSYIHHGSGTLGNEKPDYGVPGVAQLLHTLRFADNVEEAVKMQLSYPFGIRAEGLWVDVNGGACVIECRDPLTLRGSGDHDEVDYLYATNNVMHASLEPFLVSHHGWPITYTPHGGWNFDDFNFSRRNLCMRNALHNYHGLIDLEFVKMLLRMSGPTPHYDTIEEAEVKIVENHGAGWDSYMANLANVAVAIVRPDNGDKGKYYVCTGPAGRQLEPLSASWHFYPADPNFTFFELELAAGPAEIVEAAKKRSQYDLYYAHHALRKLTYADIAYAPLDAVFNRAAKENEKGYYYHQRAASGSDNTSLAFYSKALRAYTRCQTFAKKVYESLNPPATTPTELGLREWLGSWGQWDAVASDLLRDDN